MSTRSTSTTIDATAAVPIDVASKVLLGARHAYRRTEAGLRLSAQRTRLWVERQHLQPEQVMQLGIVLVYGIVAVLELVTERRKGR